MIHNKTEIDEKSSFKNSAQSLLDNKLVKIGFVVAVAIGGLYVLSKAFKAIGSTVSSFKDMANSFKG